MMRKIGLTALVGTVVSISSLSAIERPDQGKKKPIPVEPQGGILDEEDVKVKPEAEKPLEIIPPVEREKKVAHEKIAYLGVGGDPASKALLTHLGLESGLLVRTVDPQSPAGMAGLAEFDIISSFGEVQLGDQESLRMAISDYEPGDEVLLKMIRRGKPIDQKITLGTNRNIDQVRPGAIIPNQAMELQRLMDRDLGNIGGLVEGELLEQLENAFGKRGQGLRELRLNMGGELFGNGDAKLGLQQVGSMKFVDGEGSIEMKMDEGGRELTIRDSKNKVLFEGPYNTDEEKNAVPEEFKERVEKLGLGNGVSGHTFKLQLNGEELFGSDKKEKK